MEGKKRLTAGDERRKKLLEYLASKGKIKPENNCKPYLKDRTNLQNKKPEQIFEAKKSASSKATQSSLVSNKSKNSIGGSLLQKSIPGRLPPQQAVPASRPGNNPAPRNPLPSKYSAQRPDHAGRTSLRPSVPNPNARKQERSKEADVTLTVVLTKKQHGEKPEICVMDKTPPMTRDRHTVRIASRDRERSVSRDKHTPGTTQATNTPGRHHDYKTPPPAGNPVPVASSGHIRIVSRSSLPGAKSANERSFLIKSSRKEVSKQPLDSHKEPLESNPHRTRKSSAAAVTSTNVMGQKKMITGPVSPPKIRQNTLDFTSRRTSSSQETSALNKQMVQRRRTAPPGGNKVEGFKDECKKQSRESKQAGVTSATKETTTRASSMTTADTTSRPQTPRMTAEERKKQLQEWLASKGKTYKRPPMILPPKRPPTVKKANPCNRSFWEGLEEEEELRSLTVKINQTLSECLELIEKGIPAEDIHAALDEVPEGKKFAKYWVCKARLLEREGVYDVIDVYKQGVQFGATPIDELRDVVFDIMKNINKKTKVVTFGPLPADDVEEDDDHEEFPVTPYTSRTEEVKTPGTGTSICDQGSAVKLQVTSLSSKKMMPGSGQEWKRLTPVRRSLRIHHSVSQYPEVVQEHDTVVSSLEELLDQADTDGFLYIKNDALPEEADHTVISLWDKEQQEGAA